MILFLIIFLSTLFTIIHLISSKKFNPIKLKYHPPEKGICILVPCYNESKIIPHTLEGLKKINYKNFDVIFINDGSQDATLNTLHKLLNLTHCTLTQYTHLDIFGKVHGTYHSQSCPNIYVIDKSNSGKADSLNCATNFTNKELILTLDADCILDPDALILMNQTFDDNSIIASGGTVHAMQLFKLHHLPKLIVLLQALDLIKGFYIYKSSLAYNNALSIISGAFGVFNKVLLVDLGGFQKGLGEDIDITLRFQQYALTHDKKVTYTLNAVCFTECPESWHDLIKQRVRWQKAFIDSFLKNEFFLINYMFNYTLCFFFMIDALIVSSCSIVVLFINTLLIFNPSIYSIWSYLFFCYIFPALFNILYCILAIQRAKKHLPTLNTKLLYWTIPFDFLIFRPLSLFFFIIGTFTYPFSNKNWNKVNRTSNSYEI